MMDHSQTMQSRGFRFGWWVLFVVSILGAINHLVLIFNFGEQVLFIGWVGLNLFSLLVLLFPFRRGERWAWLASWIPVIAFGLPVLLGSEIGPLYLGAAALMLIGMLLTASAFTQN